MLYQSDTGHSDVILWKYLGIVEIDMVMGKKRTEG